MILPAETKDEAIDRLEFELRVAKEAEAIADMETAIRERRIAALEKEHYLLRRIAVYGKAVLDGKGPGSQLAFDQAVHDWVSAGFSENG